MNLPEALKLVTRKLRCKLRFLSSSHTPRWVFCSSAPGAWWCQFPGSLLETQKSHPLHLKTTELESAFHKNSRWPLDRMLGSLRGTAGGHILWDTSKICDNSRHLLTSHSFPTEVEIKNQLLIIKHWNDKNSLLWDTSPVPDTVSGTKGTHIDKDSSCL